MRRKNSNPMKIAALILSAVGLVFLIAGIFFLAIGIKNTTSGLEVDAVITNVDDFYEDVYVDYQVDGIMYTDVKIKSYSSTMDEGDHIKIYVDPEDPSELMLGSELLLFGGIFGGVGFIITAVGAVLLIINLRKNSLAKRLVEEGYYVEARYECTEMTGLRINSRPTYVVRCSYLNPEDGDIYSFKSQYLKYDPGEYLSSDVIKVYVDRNDFTKNYVDISEVTDRYIEC